MKKQCATGCQAVKLWRLFPTALDIVQPTKKRPKPAKSKIRSWWTQKSPGLSARQTPAGNTPAGKEPKEQSRLDFYLQHLREARPYFPALVQYLAVDGYYACRSFMDGNWM